jgi:UDP:flavonoid glycosyltransferase YjiC (YdhE family)
MISNGGYGATQMALAHGIPVVIAGATEDKMEVAGRVEWSGCGINLRKKRPSSRIFLDAVREILGNKSYRDNARRFQDEVLRSDAPARAVALLEGLVDEQKGGNV